MVLESLVNPFTAEKHPWEMFFIGLLYNTIAIFLALWIFPSHASLIMVFLTVLACVPFIYATIKMEEEYDLKVTKEILLMKEHSRVLFFLMFLFLGIVASVSFWYVVLPTSLQSTLFVVQSNTIQAINQHVTGNAISTSNIFFKIFVNNFKVLLFCLLFSFFYGSGAIFILTWNASVIGVAIGNFISSNISQFSTYFTVVPLALMRYMTHGLFEVGAYFAAGLAGGIISIAVIRHDFGTQRFSHVLLDSIDLVIVSLILLLFAAIIEVFITPVLF
jgi:uncharacterized membrane protein SpoIIM required for sporulation|tara:strand:- start:679 stop:1503 length:825 start_codon:yes stop_codon:yes gene_type:complete